MPNNKITPQQMFKAAQQPVSWLLSAEGLRDAAEVIISHEDVFLQPYLRAYDEATHEAMAKAYADGADGGSAEIRARTPNYPPAQVLYAYAIENVLKGLIVSHDPSLINGDKLNIALKEHDILALAERARFAVRDQEKPVLEALSQLSVWAGRYPSALRLADFVGVPNPDELMDYGSRHPIMRSFFDRAHKELEARLPKAIDSRFGAVVVLRQPGT